VQRHAYSDCALNVKGGGREDTDLGFPYTSVHLDLCSVRIADNVHGPVVWSEGRENGKGHASLLGVRADAGNVLSHATNMVAETDKLRFDETAAFAFRFSTFDSTSLSVFDLGVLISHQTPSWHVHRVC
jgi:hypothetical protein